MYFLRAGLAALVLTAFAPQAWAQTPPPGYAPPPAGYAPPPGYMVIPAPNGAAPAPVGLATMPYKDGYPIPAGYPLEERYRKE